MVNQERVQKADFGSITPVVWFLPAALLLIAIAPLPYGYYTLTRVVICAGAAFLAWKHFAGRGLGFWPLILGLVPSCSIR